MGNCSTRPTWHFSGAEVLITGGSHGIGLATANAFADAGARVTITGRRASAHDYETDLGRFRYLQLEAADNAALDALPRHLDRLDILVNNAGESFPGGTDQWHADNFALAVQVNLLSVFRLSGACLPLLRQSRQDGGASIVGIASLTSYFGFPLTPGYGAAKAGLVALTRTMAAQWGRYGIRVNAVAAGTIETNMGGGTAESSSFGWQRAFHARTPLGRMGEPGEVADPLLFLCSGAARYMSGTTIMVDGGYSATTWEIPDMDQMLAFVSTPAS